MRFSAAQFLKIVLHSGVFRGIHLHRQTGGLWTTVTVIWSRVTGFWHANGQGEERQGGGNCLAHMTWYRRSQNQFGIHAIFEITVDCQFICNNHRCTHPKPNNWCRYGMQALLERFFKTIKPTAWFKLDTRPKTITNKMGPSTCSSRLSLSFFEVTYKNIPVIKIMQAKIGHL